MASDARPIRILLIDDHPLLRGGLSSVIEREPDMLVVGEADDAMCVHELLESSQPDVVVMDLLLPGVGGVDATKLIRAAFPKVRILVLTGLDHPSDLRQALHAGASGVMRKRSAPDDLVPAIRCLAEGGQYLDASLRAPIVVTEPAPPALSEREREVLHLLAAGHTARNMAAQLCISVRTLETYRARAMEKLALKSRADIVRYAAQQGWLHTI